MTQLVFYQQLLSINNLLLSSITLLMILMSLLKPISITYNCITIQSLIWMLLLILYIKLSIRKLHYQLLLNIPYIKLFILFYLIILNKVHLLLYILYLKYIFTIIISLLFLSFLPLPKHTTN